ncbi:MAG TPA: hypothetical protein PK971_05710, partial [Saprospiraceae bacterium]|nr:hypothetical protein [Saprospiraceae bacterium]
MPVLSKPAFRSIRWLLGALSLLLAACSGQPERGLRPAFYSWQTTLGVPLTTRQYLDSLGCRTLCVKVLDVGRDPLSAQVTRYAQLRVADTAGLGGLGVVPTVFITNEVFRHSSPQERAAWVGPMAAALRPWLLRSGQEGGELQFDCDWTASTREAYFSFLREMRAALPRGSTLSATVRLHQYKFPDQTGVPPVERGMLMLYNTGDIDQPVLRNSIFDAADARKYLAGAP